jgi:uncharacterized membrane protein SpoIIM required for sporulation
MNAVDWITQNQAKWEHLDSLLKRCDGRQLKELSKAELKEFSALYRSAASDLALAQSQFPRHQIRLFLNDLVGRTHQVMYVSPPVKTSRVLLNLLKEIPQIFRSHIGYFFSTLGFFLMWTIIGFVATQYNPSTVELFLDAHTIARLEHGELWTDRIFSVTPSSVASAQILTNNVSCAIVAFAGGLTAGLLTCYIVALNGLMLGVIISAGFNYNLHKSLFTFIIAHGQTEICAILVAAMGGFMVARGILAPGLLPRRDAINEWGQHAIKLVFVCMIVLTFLGFIEGFISPNPNIPVQFKVALGSTLLLLFLTYLTTGDYWLSRFFKEKKND